MKNATQIGLMKTAAMVFGMTGLFTVLYLITGIVLSQLPTLLIFCILGGMFLMPVEWFLMLRQSKKDYLHCAGSFQQEQQGNHERQNQAYAEK